MRTTQDLDSPDITPPPRAESRTLSALHAAVTEFNRHNISYCYWKTSRRIQAVLGGEADLDLLVAREDQYRAEMILLAQGFKLFPTVAHRDHPSILSFLGHDQASGRLVHIHLHFRLIVGERLLRNYHLPWEDVVLARTIVHPVLHIRMLEPAVESLLLAVRTCLELRRSDLVTLRRWREAKQKIALDRADVAARSEPAALHDLAKSLLNEELAAMVVESIHDPAELERNGRDFRRRMTRELSIFRTYNTPEARLRASWRGLFWIAGNINRHLLHLPRPWSRRAPGGGCTIAIVGVDGSGKTTVVAAIRTWLGPEIDVVPIYFGTGGGRPSLLLRPFKLMVPLITWFLKTKPKGASHGNLSDRAPGPLYSLLLMVWATVVAREKHKKLLAARRGADRGLVIITDRYPQDEIIGFNDGPLLTRLDRVPHWLRRFEAGAYALTHRLPPDLVLMLDVLPETAARREPDMHPLLIRKRIAELRRLTFAGAPVVRINAERPLDEVVRAAQNEIWQLL
jgi:thymidylate kinase